MLGEKNSPSITAASSQQTHFADCVAVLEVQNYLRQELKLNCGHDDESKDDSNGQLGPSNDVLRPLQAASRQQPGGGYTQPNNKTAHLGASVGT